MNAVAKWLCIGLLAVQSGCAATTGQTGDESITAAIRASIAADASLRSQPISVATHGGVVELTGSVDSAYSKDKAGQYAKRVEGVKQVRNALIVP